MATFKEVLRDLRTAKGLSQKDLADLIGVSQVAIVHWEKGGRIPSLLSAQAISRALGVSITVFDGCDFEEADQKGPLGRPPKVIPPPHRNGKRKK